MNLSSIMEKWDAVLYLGYNFVAQTKWVLFDSFRFRKIVKRNKELKNKHEGETCYLILNGPSIRAYDLSCLRDKTVFATNYFFRSDLAKSVLPDYICWQDSKILVTDESEEIKNEIREVLPNAKMIFNIKGHKRDEVYYTYNKHLPYLWGISSRIDGNCSAFSTVALYAINVALYMGFKRIYILGLDFEPGGFKHFTNLGKNSECSNPTQTENRDRVCSEYWTYSKAHFEAFALNKHANKRGCKIINLNPNSYVRAFEFGNYEEILNVDGELTRDAISEE